MKYLTLLGLALCITAYTVTLMGSIDHGIWRGSVARLGFILAMATTALLAHKALRPTGGWLEPLIAKLGGSVIHRVRVIVYLVGIGFPLAMAGLSVIGYGFTARELLTRATWTFSAGLIAATLWPGVKIASAYLWNLLTGSNTKAGSHTNLGKNTSRRFADADEDESKSQVTGVLGEHFLELKHHLAFLCQCGLVIAAIVGLGWLWIDVLPNSHLGNPVVWSVQDTDLQSTDVTLAHLLLAAATLFIAFQVAKLLPALFDALVLQRVSFDEGMEHFSLVLGRFLLFGVGCFIACRLIGIRWQTIQWLAVGLTIGLGFGLQDMVRNLFGGLIVLFEKPARLGDCVTVGSITGRISAQRLRTTVLSDDEGREVIIPNKNFVSEDVVNWMGAGRLSVIPLEVAVTRDERPADICRTLQELIIDQPDVLLTPAPQATLVCVGQSSQRIEVRAWIEERQNATRFRDNLLKIVRKDLQSRNLWVNNQPTQPEMNDILSRDLPNADLLDDDLMDDDILDDFMSPKPKKRRRRA